MKSYFSLFVFLTAILIIPKIHFEDIIYEPLFYTVDAYIKLSEALEHQTLGSLAVEQVVSIYHELQEQTFRLTEKLGPLYKMLKEMLSVLNKHTESNSEIDKHKSRFNFASVNGGAKIIKTRPSAKIGKAILVDDDDNYALYDCKLEPLEIVISLTEDVLVDTLLILNLENHASYFKDFEVMISTTYETEEWLSIGIFQAAWKKGWQKFDLPQKWARYVKLVLFSHHGSESLCTITQIKVLGVTMLENFRDEFLVKDEILANEMFMESSEKPKAFFPVLRREKPFDVHYSRLDSMMSGKLQENKPVYLHLSMASHKPEPLPPKGYNPYSDLTDDVCDPIEFFFTAPKYYEGNKKNFEPIPNYSSINFSKPHPPQVDISDDVCHVYEFFVKMPKHTRNNCTQNVNKIYQKQVLQNPKTPRNFRIFASNLLTHLFRVPISPPAIIKDSDSDANPIVEANNYISEIMARGPPNFKYDFRDSMAFNILREERKSDPNESIFKTLTRRLKGLEKTIIVLEAYIDELKHATQIDMTKMSESIQSANDWNKDLQYRLNRATIRNEELEKRLENLEKTIYDINSPDYRLSNLSLIILLFLVLNIIWKILEKAAFSPVEQQQRWSPGERYEKSEKYEKGKSSSSKDLLAPPKPSVFKKKSRVNFGGSESHHLSPALSNSNSLGDLHVVSPPQRAKSPLSGSSIKPATITFSGLESLKYLQD